MQEQFNKVKDYVLDIGYVIKMEDAKEGMLMIEDKNFGMENMVLSCEDPILVMEQQICELKADLNQQELLSLMKMNRTLVHGAFAIDEEGKKLVFRDTLALENLDRNEVESSVHSLSLALAENFNTLMQIARR